ncbi:aBC superfamily ATP binding cassette transporter probable permease [Prevotella sp. CAG:1058]|nr:aBC superfamily ATP binding cassette transporter probable permease [Prevotella sp. CAG:1058]
MRDIIVEIWSTVRRNKLRTALTGFAVAWGIFMLIFLLGAGNGLINAMLLQNSKFLDNSMIVSGGMTTKAYNGLKEGRAIELNDRDMAVTGNNFSANVDETGGSVSQSGLTFSSGANYVGGTLEGVYPNEIEINKKEMLYGRFINHIDIEQKRKVLVLSEDDAKELMPNGTERIIGQYVDVDSLAFRVVGVYKADRSGMNTSAYTAFTTIRTIYNKGDEVGSIVFSFKGLDTQEANDAFETQYRARINGNHSAAPDDEGSVWIWNRFTQNLQMNTGMNMIRTALWIVGLFTLLSGIVGVSNIMLITVKERTREFGIRKAIGARPSSILRLIIIESIVITTFFGYIGMVIGVAANEYMDATIGQMKVNSGLFEATMFYNPTVGIGVCIAATVVMIVAGTLAGLIPARKAARIRPIEALRAE